MPGFIPGIQAVMDCRNKSGNDRGVARRSLNKKWGTIFKKGAPHFAIFGVVEGFCEGQKWGYGAPLFVRAKGAFMRRLWRARIATRFPTGPARDGQCHHRCGPARGSGADAPFPLVPLGN